MPPPVCTVCSSPAGISVAIQHFPLKLVSRRMLAPSVGHYTFVRDDGAPLDFIPGQFIQVHFTYADGTATKAAAAPMRART